MRNSLSFEIQKLSRANTITANNSTVTTTATATNTITSTGKNF